MTEIISGVRPFGIPTKERPEKNGDLSLFQNPVGFEPGSSKNRQKPGFSTKFTEAVPKTEVLEQPQLT
jgi:hypothetical protein